MSDVERHSGVRNATILLLITSALQIQAGYSFLQFAIIMTYPLNSIFGIFMIGLGVLSLCTSVLIWLQNSWATKIITGLGLAVCVTLFIFRFYVIIVVFADIYWIALHWIRPNQTTKVPDWAPDWNDD